MEKTDSADQVLDIIQRAEAKGQMKQPFKPNLRPIIGKGGTTVPRIGGSIKVKATGQGSGQAPVTSGGIVVGQGLGKSGGQAGAFESNKPIKIKSGMAATVEPDKDKQSLSLLV